MEGSEGSERGLGVGTIVWVRRRNGSWWPGRILGQEELSASHLMSPRSGTPVKLLGREDASVDWYNLEKSKRVKAFRCGEFDACIERAEAAHGVPIKKREKYARREDAILHALELEREFLEKKKQPKVGGVNKYLVVSKTELPSGNHLKHDESSNHCSFIAKSQHQSRKAGPSEAYSIEPFSSEKGKGDKYSSWEDDVSEATPRMRGLQDFGLRSAQSKRKVDALVANEITQRHFLVGSHGRAFPGSMQGMEEKINVKTGKNFPPLKKRRTQGCLDEELVTKRRDRRRPLVQVLQSSAKLSASQPLQSDDSPTVNMHAEDDQTLTLSTAEKSSGDNRLDSKNCLDQTECSSEQMQISPVQHRNPGSLVEENASSGLNEAGESDSSEEVYSDEDPETEDDATLYQASTRPLLSMSKNEGRCVENDDMIMFPDQEYPSIDGNDEAFVPDHVHSQYLDQQSEDTLADFGVSKWNLKGKRNTRNLLKRPTDSMIEMPDHIYLSSMNGGRSYESKGHPLMSSRGKATRSDFYQKYDVFYGNDFLENDLSPQSTRDSSYRYSDEESLGMSPSGWETGDQFDQYYAGYMDMESMWVDVDLKVQARYQGERVPLVSLMSKLNGKAIIGHPVQIEMLNDGSADSLIARNDSGEDPTSCDGNETPPPVWRTGRRTAMQRVPRSHPLPAALNGKEESFLYSDPEIKPTFKKPYAVHLDSRIRLAKKIPNSNRPTKYQKKTSKKLSLSNQKVRKLSSFKAQLKLGRVHAAGGKLNSKGRGILDNLIKPGSLPMVTCVPVKVVFSRILEAVGRSSFSAKTHQCLASCSSENKPS